MTPVQVLEYLADSTDNLREARQTLAVLKRCAPEVFVQLAVVMDGLDVGIAELAQIRGKTHLQVYGPVTCAIPCDIREGGGR